MKLIRWITIHLDLCTKTTSLKRVTSEFQASASALPFPLFNQLSLRSRSGQQKGSQRDSSSRVVVWTSPKTSPKAKT